MRAGQSAGVREVVATGIDQRSASIFSSAAAAVLDAGAGENGEARILALRIRQLTEAEADAQKASETMGIAPALMAIAAVVLIGYPALARFLAKLRRSVLKGTAHGGA